MEGIKLSERRKHPRTSHRLTARVWIDGTNRSLWYVTRDVSLGGVFISTKAPLPAGTRVTVQLTYPALRMNLEEKAIVIRSTPEGMAIRFLYRG
jgi:hypothetical protein